MEKIPGKRSGRPRKTVPDAAPIGQDGIDAQGDDGNGHSGTGAPEASTKPAGKGQELSWLEFEAMIKAEKRMVATAWHPQPGAETIGLNHCDVRVLEGEAKYQLSSGEIVNAESDF